MANGNGKQSETVLQSEINCILWRACDSFRGAVDPSEYKNYNKVRQYGHERTRNPK